MKKVLAAVFGLVFALALCACSNGSDSGETSYKQIEYNGASTQVPTAWTAEEDNNGITAHSFENSYPGVILAAPIWVDASGTIKCETGDDFKQMVQDNIEHLEGEGGYEFDEPDFIELESYPYRAEVDYTVSDSIFGTFVFMSSEDNNAWLITVDDKTGAQEGSEELDIAKENFALE